MGSEHDLPLPCARTQTGVPDAKSIRNAIINRRLRFMSEDLCIRTTKCRCTLWSQWRSGIFNKARQQSSSECDFCHLHEGKDILFFCHKAIVFNRLLVAGSQPAQKTKVLFNQLSVDGINIVATKDVDDTVTELLGALYFVS